MLLAMLTTITARIYIAEPPGFRQFKLTDSDYCIRRLPNDETRWIIIKMPDHFTYDPELNDPWFDRLVYVYMSGNFDHYLHKKPGGAIEPPVAVAAAVIDKDRVLTSLNPLRSLMTYTFKRHFTFICWVYERFMMKKHAPRVSYHTWKRQVACARPVFPISEDVHSNLWQQLFYEPRAHLPIHDLVVMRAEKEFKTKDEEFTYFNHSFFTSASDYMEKIDYYNSEKRAAPIGPVFSILANKKDMLGKTFKFGMFGHILSGNMTDRRNVVVHTYNTVETITDCDYWIPRSWGIFFCVTNIRGLTHFPSGSMMYSNGKLFGVGCFLFWREAKSILVFTDLRPYYELLQHTCTLQDQEMTRPLDNTKWLTLG